MKKGMFALLASFLLMVSCSSDKKVVEYTVASQTVDCSGVGRQKCMLVKKADSSDWEYFYSQIEGFNYEEGFEYVIEVEEQEVENPPADASSIRYILVNEVSKTAKTSEGLPVSATAQSHYQWGGKVLEIEQTTVGRGAAEGMFPVQVIKLEVTHSSTDLFKAGDIIHAELVASPKAMPVVGREYVFKATDAHPAHAKGVYMLNTDVMELVV